MTNGKDNTSAVVAVQILAWLLEHKEIKDIRVGTLQEEINIDRRVLRRYFDTFVKAEVATVRTVGITNIYTLTIKLPSDNSKVNKEQSKAARAIEARALQEKLRYTQSPNEPNWVILPNFYSDLKAYPDLVSEGDIFDPECNYEYLAGICRECKATWAADDFDKTVWLCRKCVKNWVDKDVFRQDSEDVEI